MATITSIGHFSTYGDSPKGDYLCRIEGDDRELLLFHDSSSRYDPPRVGDSFEADVVAGKKPGTWRLKRRSGSGSGGGSSSTGGGGGTDGKSFDRRPEHPRNEARMIHSNALTAAPAYYELLRTEGVIPQAQSKAAALDTLAGITRWLENGYAPILEQAAAEGASGNGAALLSVPQEVPADTTVFQPSVSANPGDELIPF